MKAHVLKLQGKDCLAELKRAVEVDHSMAEVLAEYLVQRGFDPAAALAKMPLTDMRDEAVKEKFLIRTKSQAASEKLFLQMSGSAVRYSKLTTE